MSQLEKAKLQEVQVKEDGKETTKGEAVAVQFNPTSLKLKISNSVEGGQSRGRQRRQQNAKSSTELSLELIFDSADEEDENGAPVSVRKKTAMIEKYVLPKKDGTETPPMLRFEWNEFIVTGVMESIDMDFDLFAPDGIPLRAKVSLSIKEQDSKYMMLKEGNGARTSDGSENPGGANNTRPGAGPGGGNSDRSASALEGETAPEFAARQGLDPAAWRGLGADLSAGLSLEAGAEIGFNASLNASVGLGFSAGFEAGLGVSLKASVGLEASLNASVGSGVSAGLSADASAGFALSAAGGVGAAIETVKITESQAAEEAAIRAFSSPQSLVSTNSVRRDPQARRISRVSAAGTNSVATVNATVDRTSPPARPEPMRKPLGATGLPSHSQQLQAPSQSIPPKADPRHISYGFGIPLRPTYATVIETQRVVLCSSKRFNVTSKEEPVIRKDPTTAPWIELPRRDLARAKADAIQARTQGYPCGFLYGANRRGGKS